MKKMITGAALVCACHAALAATYELQLQASHAPGGRVTLSTHSTNAECRKALKEALERDPKGGYGCIKKG